MDTDGNGKLDKKEIKAGYAEYFGKTMSDEDIIASMVKFPKLMERPIVINKEKAVIGRPPETIKQIL